MKAETPRPQRSLGKWLLLAAALLAAGALALPLVLQSPAAPNPPATHTTSTPTAVAVATAAPALPGSSWVLRQDWPGLARTFDVDRALADVDRLCSPEFAGRLAGASGGRAVAEYLAGRFEELGLQPVGDNGSYLQEFTMPLVELSAVPSLTLTNAAGAEFTARFPEDFSPIINSAAGPGSAQGPLVWANHATQQDLAGADVAGAILVCRQPVQPTGYRLALERRAAGMLIICDDAADVQMGRVAREVTRAAQPLPAAYIAPDVVSFMLAGSGHTLSELSSRAAPVPLPVQARIEVATNQSAQARAQNVLGALPGNNPDLRDEVVILGAHYDHLGGLPNGDYYAGANDNASGVAALLEIARTWQAAGFVPERTVLFAAWDGEEQGMLGSQHYVRYPAYPLANTVAMLQLDMVGASPRPLLLVDGDGLVADEALASARELGVAVEKATVGRSDHATFRNQHVPASMFIAPALDTPEYHSLADTPATLSADYLQNAGTLANLVMLRFAMAQEVTAAEGEAVLAGAGQ